VRRGDERKVGGGRDIKNQGKREEVMREKVVDGGRRGGGRRNKRDVGGRGRQERKRSGFTKAETRREKAKHLI